MSNKKFFKFIKPVYDFLYFLIYITGTLAAWIIPYPVSYFIVTNFSKLWYSLGINVKLTKKNVSRVLGIDINDPKVTDISKKIYIGFAKNIVDFLKNRIISKEQFKENIKLIGVEHLEKALKDGKGIVIFTAHLGNFEWGAARIGVEGFKIWGVGLSKNNKLIDNFYEKNRKNKCLKTIYPNKMLNVFRILKNNEIVAIPTDWDSTGTAKEYNFFNHKAKLPSGAVQIALTSGAKLIPSFIIRDNKYHHCQVICPPVELETEGKKEELIKKNMYKIIPIIEEYVRKNIDQWFLFHDIWVD
jgi:KDO2-lipid IV(A) lauroyltransferase